MTTWAGQAALLRPAASFNAVIWLDRLGRLSQNLDVASPDATNTVLLSRATDGDDLAWRELIDRHSGLVWSIVRGYEIGSDGHDDVFQTVWLRLAENLTGIREPDRLAGWLARVARNESVAVYRRRKRVTPHQTVGVDDPADLPEPDRAITLSEEQRAVRSGLQQLGAKCRRLLSLLVATPPLTYEEIGEVLDIAVGSIGPSRARCLNQLRQTADIRRITP